MEPSGIQKSPSQQPSCVPMSQLDTKMDLKNCQSSPGFVISDLMSEAAHSEGGGLKHTVGQSDPSAMQ